MAEFDRFADEYEDVVDGVSLAGESADFFASQKAAYLRERLGPIQGRLLDFGCGVGLLSRHLVQAFPDVELHGYDVSARSIANLPPELAARGRFTHRLDELDTAYRAICCVNVLHHILPEERRAILADLVGRLEPGGHLVIIEHNPYNPATRYIVATCPLDENAVLLSARESRRRLREAGLAVERTDYIAFFPRALRALRPLEPWLAPVPMGAQYAVVGRRG